MCIEQLSKLFSLVSFLINFCYENIATHISGGLLIRIKEICFFWDTSMCFIYILYIVCIIYIIYIISIICTLYIISKYNIYNKYNMHIHYKRNFKIIYTGFPWRCMAAECSVIRENNRSIVFKKSKVLVQDISPL